MYCTEEIPQYQFGLAWWHQISRVLVNFASWFHLELYILTPHDLPKLHGPLPLRSLGCGKWPGLCWFAIFHCRLVRFGDSCEHWEHLTAAVRQGETHQQICRPDLACLCMWLDTIPILPVRIIFSFFVWLVSVLIFGWSNLCAWNEVSACMSLRVGILACCTSDVKDGDVSWKMMVLTCW